jgi:tetratricopeptide (TPR) repeat protein
MFRRTLIVLAFAALLSAQPSDTAVARHLQQAAEAAQRQDFHAAVAEYRAVIEMDPAHAEAHARLGMTYRRTGQLPEAVASFEQALRIAPQLPRVGILLAVAYMELGRNKDAVPLLESAFANEDELAMRLFVGGRLVDCFFSVGDEENGLLTALKLRKLAPDDPDVLYTASKVFANLWNNTVEHLLQRAPDSHRVHQVLAEVFEAQEKYADAAQEYRQILRTDPSLPGVHYRLGRMILRSDPSSQGQQDALAAFQQELKLNPADVPSLTEAGELLLQSNQVDNAEKHFARAVALQPAHSQAIVGLAKVFLARQLFEQALLHLQRAREIDAGDEAIHYQLMTAYRQLGRMDEAKKSFETFQALKQEREKQQASIAKRFKGGFTPAAKPVQ